MTFTTVSGLYWCVLGTWKEEWGVIKNNIQIHQTISLIVLVVSICFAIGGWLLENSRKRAAVGTEELLGEFVTMTGQVVRTKFKKLRAKALLLKPGSPDKLSQIAQPRDQIQIIYENASNFMRAAFSLADDEYDFTIIERAPGGTWSFGPCLKEWNHGDPNQLFADNSKSAARLVRKSGDGMLLPSKKKAEMEGRYTLSERDKEKGGDGSIFTSFFAVDTTEGRYEFVFSVVTYGKRLCDPWNKDAMKVTEQFCREISKRLEMEFCLDVIIKL